MAGGVVKIINDKFYTVAEEVGSPSAVELETDSIDPAFSKGPKGNPASRDGDIHEIGSSSVADAETQHFMCGSTKNDPVCKSKKCKENCVVNTDIDGISVNVLMTENYKSSDVDGENLEAVNMDIDNDSDESEEHLDNELLPIIKISFRDEEIEKVYKSSFMKFLTQKIHHCTVLTNSNNSLELEIYENSSKNMLDFHLDTTPGCDSRSNRIPSYGKTNEIVLSDSNSLQETTPNSEMPSPICFNCNGKHFLRDCTLEKDLDKIAYNKIKQSASKTPKNSRYHLDENQRFGNVVPGELSEELRDALSLTKDQQPNFIYRMRLLGYPPAWLEEAKVSHSGVVVYDSNGQPITEDEEEGEIIPENARDRFDISKIIEFPGFNVPLPKDMKEEGDFHGCPALSEEQSKENLIKQLEPNAVQAYKKRSLTLPKCSPQDETYKDGKRLPSPTIEEMEEKKRLLLLELDNEDDGGEDKLNQNNVSDSEIQDESETAEDSTKVNDMNFGTPVLKSVSLYSKLPSREQFSVNVSEVINFENLPNSTGKYESMSSLINKIRDTVSRIQNEANS